ncbi:MAG: hypothetical protein ACJA0N_002661 [Pseudohongiellaceae bacterium]|jgi:hypothetical protein
MLVALTLPVGIWFFYLAFNASRKLRLVWISPAILMILSCLTLVVDPVPPEEVSDVTQWQSIWLLTELLIRAGIVSISLLVTAVYWLSPRRDDLNT